MKAASWPVGTCVILKALISRLANMELKREVSQRVISVSGMEGGKERMEKGLVANAVR